MKKILGYMIVTLMVIWIAGCTVADVSRTDNSVDNSVDDHSTTSTTTNEANASSAETNSTDSNITSHAKIASNEIRLSCNLKGYDDKIYILGIIKYNLYKDPFYTYTNDVRDNLIIDETEEGYYVKQTIVIPDNSGSTPIGIKVELKDSDGVIILNKICEQPAI